MLGTNINQVPKSASTNPAYGAGRKEPNTIVIVSTPSGDTIKNQRGYIVFPLKIPMACQIDPTLNAIIAVRSPNTKCSII